MAPEVKITSNGAALKLVTEMKDLELGRPFFRAVGKEVIESTHRNVERQVEPSGTPMKRNAPSTMEAKRRAGQSQLSLVAEFNRFVNRGGFKSTATKKGVVVEPTSFSGGGRETTKTLTGFVQQMGYFFFGIDRKGRANIAKLLKKRIEQALKKART